MGAYADPGGLSCDMAGPGVRGSGCGTAWLRCTVCSVAPAAGHGWAIGTNGLLSYAGDRWAVGLDSKGAPASAGDTSGEVTDDPGGAIGDICGVEATGDICGVEAIGDNCGVDAAMGGIAGVDAIGDRDIRGTWAGELDSGTTDRCAIGVDRSAPGRAEDPSGLNGMGRGSPGRCGTEVGTESSRFPSPGSVPASANGSGGSDRWAVGTWSAATGSMTTDSAVGDTSGTGTGDATSITAGVLGGVGGSGEAAWWGPKGCCLPKGRTSARTPAETTSRWTDGGAVGCATGGNDGTGVADSGFGGARCTGGWDSGSEGATGIGARDSGC